MAETSPIQHPPIYIKYQPDISPPSTTIKRTLAAWQRRHRFHEPVHATRKDLLGITCVLEVVSITILTMGSIQASSKDGKPAGVVLLIVGIALQVFICALWMKTSPSRAQQTTSYLPLKDS